MREIKYGKISAIEIVLIVTCLLLDSMIEYFNLGAYRQWVYLLFFVLELLYLWVLYHLISRLHAGSKAMAVFALLVMLFVAAGTFVATNPFVQLAINKTQWLILVHTFFCALQMYVISILIIEMYKEKQNTSEIVWSSLVTFFMIPIAWTSLFEIINLARPGATGIHAENGFQSYSETLYYSISVFCTSGNFDASAYRIVRNISLIYRVWGVLYLVFLIGRAISISGSKK
ncbi:MAG: hypothetical protein IPJ81_12515 [Chitinophagaceae bacterium]|nr:hypothetical protein [Chitinophagaceae bacterium]